MTGIYNNSDACRCKMDQSIVVRQDTNTSDTKSEEMSRHASSVKEESDDDEREECPEGITCGLRSYVMHKSKYKHIRPASKGKAESVSEDDEREECPDGTTCGARSNTLHRKKFKHIHPPGQVKEGPRDYDASGADKPPPSPPDENDMREECPEGTGCGKRTNTLHRKKFKHILPTMEAAKRPKDYERASDDDEREECPEGTACEKRKNGRHKAKYKHVVPTNPEKKYLAGGAQAGSVSRSQPENEARTDDVTEASDDDEREECPEGTGCGMRTNVLHRRKYKHVKPTVAAGKNQDNEELSDDDEREECPDGTACEKRRNGRHRGKYKHIKITRPQEKKSSEEMPSEDDEREECPDGTACKVRTNTLHREKYKHIRISTLEEVAANEEPSDDDEREECQDGVGCKVRTNVLHREKYKHLRKPAQKRPSVSGTSRTGVTPNKRQAGNPVEGHTASSAEKTSKAPNKQETSNETPSDDDERQECPDGTACKVRTNALHRSKYKHVRISSTEEIAAHEEPSDDDEREECPDGTGCKVRSNNLHHGKYKHTRKASSAAASAKTSGSEQRTLKETHSTSQTQKSAEKPSAEPKDEVPDASDDDERTECPDGTGCGMRFNTLHRDIYKHLRPTPPAGSQSAVANPPSDDDERAECPSGTACEKRPNPRHRSVFKHVTVTGPVAERPQGPGYDITDPPSEDDERVECPEGTSCRIRSSTLHRGKYKHTVTYESDYELPEEAGDDESKVDAKRPRLLPDRHAGKRSEYDHNDLAMIRDMDRELGPELYEREPVDPDYVPDEDPLSQFMRQ